MKHYLSRPRRRASVAILFTTLAVSLGIAVTAAPAANAIISGDPAVQMPWVGRLTAPKGTHTQVCTATLIDRSWAISAAHCLKQGLPVASYAVTFDTYDSDDTVATGVRRQVDQAALSGSAWDIALLHLSAPVDSIDPVTLAQPGHSTLYKKGTTQAITGWGGFQVSPGYNTNHNLRYAQHVVKAPSSIANGWLRSAPASGYDGEWAWHGDSGGPILNFEASTGAYTQLGVFVDFTGGKCSGGICMPVLANFWSRVDPPAVSAWINTYVRDQGTSVPWNSAAGDTWTSPTGTSGLAELTYGHQGCVLIDATAQCMQGTWPVLPGAPVIWAHRLTATETTATFQKTIRVTADQARQTWKLTSWADDDFTASVNGTAVLSGNYYSRPLPSVLVTLHEGMNTIMVTVNNGGGHDPQGNPAGLAWNLTPA